MSRNYSMSSHMIYCLKLALAVAVAASSFAGAPPTAVAVAASVPSFSFSGAGDGHGVGLSQYGAKAYAERGESATWIVRHYFPGTAIAKPTVKRVKVNLDPSASYSTSKPSVHNAGYTATRWMVRAGWPGMGITLSTLARTLTLPDSAGPYSFEVSSTKVAVADKNKHPVAGSPFSGTVSLTMTGSVSPALLEVVGRSGPFMSTSLTPSTNVRYRGSLLVRSNGTKLKLLDELPMDDYLCGVVPRETPASWPRQALGAQAIVSRSYAYAGANELYCDTRSQMYNGYSHGTRGSEASKMHEDSRSNAAVRDTSGECVTYAGHVVATYFCSSSGGYTADEADIWGGAEIPYLEGVPDPYERGPYDPWTTPLTRDGMALARALAPHVSSAPSGAGSTVYVKSLAIHRAWPSGFVRTVDIAWSKGPASTGVSGTTIRAALGLRSTKFFINARGGRLQGSGRYAEAVAASARLFPSAGNAKSAIVVNGDDEHYADIACAVALSGVAKGPVLFVKSGSVPSNVNSEIRRLGVKKLYIVGGTTAVSAGVTAQLASLVPDTERLGGADRYKTAAIVARKAVALGASSSQAVLCAGSGWSDAAVAAALAGGAKRPLLLTAKSSLPGSTASALTDLKVTRTTLVARADAVTTSTIAQVCAITGEHAVAKRIGATGDRYDIAASAASWSVSSLGYSTSTIYVASGRAISDAFITAGFAARLKHPMLLTDTYTPSDAATSYLLGAVSARTSVTIVGGQSAVGIACALQLQSDGH